MSIQHKQTIIDRIIFIGIIALLIFAPLAFGSVHVWAYTIIEIGVFFLLALWVVDRLFFSKSDAIEWVRTSVNLVLILLIALIGIQMVPLPSSMIALLSPRTFADKMQLFDMIQKAYGAALPKPSWICLSYYFHPTLTESLKLMAHIGMFFLVLNTIRSRRQINILIYSLILVGLFEASYAVVQIFSTNPQVWWWRSRVGTFHHFASGTFIGSNHFAAYMGMVLCLLLGFIVAQKRKTARLTSGLGGFRSSFQRAVGWFSPESEHPKLIFFFFVAVFIGVAILLSASRGSIFSIGISMVLLSVLLFSKRQHRIYGGLALSLFLATLAYGLHVGIDPTLDKFKQNQGFYDRLKTTRTIIPMIADYPIIGVGWGNFRYLYPRYIDDFDRVSTSGYAHNDWIESGTEAGIAGGVLILIAFAGYLVKMIRIWMRRRDLYALGVGTGVITGLLSIGIHSFFDFNMHVPANALTLSVLLGIGYAAVHRQGHGYSENFFYTVRKIRLSWMLRIVMGCAAVMVLFAGIFASGRHFLAEAHCPTEWNSTLNLNWSPELMDIEKAISYNPLNAEYYFKKANYYINLTSNQISHKKKDAESRGQRTEDRGQRTEGGEEAKRKAQGTKQIAKSAKLIQGMKVMSGEEFEREKNERAIKSLENAVRLNPARGIYWYELGKRYSLKDYDSLNYLNRWLPAADACFDMGIYCAPKDADMLFHVAWYWVWRSGLFPRNNEPVSSEERVASQQKPIRSQEDGVLKFLRLFQRSLLLNPDNLKRAASRVWEYYPYDDVVLEIVPEGDEALERRVLQVIVKETVGSRGRGSGNSD
ncbi:O-antigen ligase family protein [Thermodesulfobacteriota bacterium]